MGCTCVQSYEAPGNIVLNYGQIMYLWIQAGGPANSAAWAAAIAMAESGGNSTATCVNGGAGCGCNGCVDRGIWQIDSVHGAQSSYDLMTNARAAVAISNNGRNWSAWTTQSVAQQHYRAGVAPEPFPINATNGAANGPPSGGVSTGGPAPGGGFSTGGGTATLTGGDTTVTETGLSCAWYDFMVDPAFCAPQALGSASKSGIQYGINGVIKMVLNPVIQLISGVFGMGMGVTLMLLGIFIMVMESKTARSAATKLGPLFLGAAGAGAGWEAGEASAAAAPAGTAPVGTSAPMLGAGQPPQTPKAYGYAVAQREPEVTDQLDDEAYTYVQTNGDFERRPGGVTGGPQRAITVKSRTRRDNRGRFSKSP